MALGGYKRVARAALSGRKRVQERSKTRHSEGQNINRAQPSAEFAVKQEISDEVAHMDSPFSAADSQKNQKRSLSTPEKERFKASESWNAEQQRLRNEEKKRLRKLEKQHRRRERKKQSQTEPRTKHVETAVYTAGMQKEGAALEASEASHTSDIHDFPIRNAAVDEGLKYDLAVKYGWVNPVESNSGSTRDNFVDFAFEDDHPAQLERRNAVTDELDVLQELRTPLRHSPPIEYRPRTPTKSPPIQEPMTPSQPTRTQDVLVVTPSRRRPSVQLEFIVSSKSSITARAAANMLVTLKSRTARLNTQIAGFNRHLFESLNKLTSLAKATLDDSVAKAKVLRKIITAMEEHSNQVFLMELALRDLVEEGDEDLPGSIKRTEGEFADLVKVYERKMHKLMKIFSPEALERTLGEVGDTQGESKLHLG